MAVFRIEVDVSLARPIRTDATAFVTVEADHWIEAELTAISMVMATRKIVMPVATRSWIIE